MISNSWNTTVSYREADKFWLTGASRCWQWLWSEKSPILTCLIGTVLMGRSLYCHTCVDVGVQAAFAHPCLAARTGWVADHFLIVVISFARYVIWGDLPADHYFAFPRLPDAFHWLSEDNNELRISKFKMKKEEAWAWQGQDFTGQKEKSQPTAIKESIRHFNTDPWLRFKEFTPLPTILKGLSLQQVLPKKTISAL